MKKFAFALMILALSSTFALGGVIYIEGPDDRGEGAIPPATGAFGEAGTGTFDIDIYAEDFPGFAGFQLEAQFTDDLGIPSPAFLVGMGGPQLFLGRKITHNADFLPDVFAVVTGRAGVGLMSQEHEFDPITWEDLGLVDKSITDKTWLMTVTYEYSMDAAPGTYTIGVNADNTVFSDADAGELGYSLVTGSVTIGQGEEPPVPEPATMALLGMGIVGLVGYGRKKVRK